MGEVITFYGETDGSSTTGTFDLNSDVLHSAVSYIRPDRGMRVKIWAALISGAACTVFVEQTEDVTESTPTYKKIAAFHLSSEGQLHLDERHAVELFSRDGKQAFRLTWSQSAAAKSYVMIKCEFEYSGVE